MNITKMFKKGRLMQRRLHETTMEQGQRHDMKRHYVD